MKTCIKKMLVLVLAGALGVGGAITSFAGEWVKTEGTVTQKNWEGVEYTYPITNWSFVDDSGATVTSGTWEGGHIKEDGILAIDQAFYINGKLQYMDKDGNVYDSTLEWKTQLSKAWTEAIGFRDDITTYTLDFQLPANWSEECPKPLLDALIDYACGDSWAGGDFGYSWNIDESNMLHINAEFRGYF